MTNVLMMQTLGEPSLGIQPCSLYFTSRYSAISEPIWLPVRSSIAPERPRTATPIRSQSGSVAITTSHFALSAVATAIASASAFSGLGDLTVGNRGSKAICSGTSTTLQPAWIKSGNACTAPVPWMFV